MRRHDWIAFGILLLVVIGVAASLTGVALYRQSQRFADHLDSHRTASCLLQDEIAVAVAESDTEWRKLHHLPQGPGAQIEDCAQLPDVIFMPATAENLENVRRNIEMGEQ